MAAQLLLLGCCNLASNYSLYLVSVTLSSTGPQKPARKQSMNYNVFTYGVNNSFLKGSPSVITVYMTTVAMNIPKMLKIILPIMT